MNVKAILSRLMLCLCSLLAVSSAYAESVLIATPQQGVGITVDVFDTPDAPGGKPSSTSVVSFQSPAFYIPSVQSFKGKVYMFWSNNDDQKNIHFSTSSDGKSWSKEKPIPVDSIFSDVSVSVFKQKLVLTFADPQSRLKTISSENGTAWSDPSLINTVHTAVNNKPVVYNGQLFVFYSQNSGKAIYYVTSTDGVRWSRENVAVQENADSILTMVPVVYNGKLWAYYAFENGAMFTRTYDRAGNWGAKQELAGIIGKGPKGFLNSATMIGGRVFISSNTNTFYSNDGLHWDPYFSRNLAGKGGFPSGLGVSYAITASDLTVDNPQLPADLATGLSHTDYATFAWRSFIALNNAANTPLPANRGVGNPRSSFADSGKVSHSPSPLLWQTFAHRTELFPGLALGKNHVGGPTRPFASSPQYSYTDFSKGKVIPLAPGASFNHYNNLDEATQIGQNAIFFPVNPPRAAMKGRDYAPSNDSQILFEAKANPVIYEYARGLDRYPPHIVLPDGALEVKAAWRKLADIPPSQRARYLTATVVTYHGKDSEPVAYNEEYALVALHIIHKTPNYPTFIFATFEHEDALTLPDGSPTGLYYIANYDKIAYSPGSASVATFSSDSNTTHQVTLPIGVVAKAKQTPPIYSGSNGIPEGQAGPIRVVQPQTVYSEVTAVNDQVKQLMNASSEFNNSVWKYYHLKGVQAIPSSTETDPDYYLANIMVESSQPGIQLFRGSNSFPIPNTNILTNTRDVKNILVPDYDHSIQSHTMGGCMGCHGIAQSSLKQGFSFLFDAINRANFTHPTDPTGFSNPETIGLPDTRTQQKRALKYSLSLGNKGVVEKTGNQQPSTSNTKGEN
ncbi:sialidase family protein [Pseudomonas batumici]|uniref:Cytochrome c family protein n=1 Tax=Pseudomonas batumici TaxID=226910 RepID=A0A0C2EXH7_9PSED|nr:sialidase family protein [Pseudomonas batumici]KIH83508.1 Cytochrome c family protein [Pseudomonas batumici]